MIEAYAHNVLILKDYILFMISL